MLKTQFLNTYFHKANKSTQVAKLIAIQINKATNLFPEELSDQLVKLKIAQKIDGRKSFEQIGIRYQVTRCKTGHNVSSLVVESWFYLKNWSGCVPLFGVSTLRSFCHHLGVRTLVENRN